ncbi:MAG: hypothetical protein ACE5FG_05390 [Myxococcota bacterium]
MTRLELAVEFTDLWRDLDATSINTMLAKNVNVELLEFFASYAQEFANECVSPDEQGAELRRRLPNLLIIGYIIRLLEERLR